MSRCVHCGTDLGDPRYASGTWTHDDEACIARLKERVGRLERIVGLAARFAMSLGGLRLRKRDFEKLDPLLTALNKLPVTEFARCADASE